MNINRRLGRPYFRNKISQSETASELHVIRMPDLNAYQTIDTP